MRRRLIAICLACAAAASLVVAVPSASAAKKRSTVKKPKITRVLPMRLAVGQRLTIRGKNFNPRRKRNTVVFRAPGGRSAFAKPRRATRRKLVVVVPAAVSRLLVTESGRQRPARFKLRVLNRKFSRFTSRRLSPVIVGAADVDGGSAPGTPGNAACNDSADHDGDLLPNALEVQLRTDPCLRDTDLDGVEDGYEYQSAKDLNDDESQQPNTSLPYPGKRPYPNPLDSGDAGIDFDRDVLTLAEEQKLWRYTVANGAPRTLTPLSYSDGEQISAGARGSDGRRRPTIAAAGYGKQASFLAWASANGYRVVMLSDGGPWWDHGVTRNPYGLLDFDRSGSEEAAAPPGYWNSEAGYYDHDGDGFLSDDERDEDGDGLTNYDETHGRMTPGYWAACYSGEAAHPVLFAGTDVTDPDSDGDGVLDGADDQDHDDVPNVMELSRNAASGLWDAQAACKPRQGLPSPPDTHHADAYGRVNPFNPCLPATWSRTCTRHPSLTGEGAPFDGSLDWVSLN